MSKVFKTSAFIIIIGVFEIINLHKAQAANCGGEIPCGCGDTVVASTTLTNNLDCSDEESFAHGLIVGADNITIDGNNHTMAGSNSWIDSNSGIHNPDGYDNITIQNFTNITNFDIGIYLASSTASIIQNNTISTSSHYGIYLNSSNNNIIIDNFTHSNNVIGLYLNHSNYNTITSNTANLNYLSGITLDSSTNNTLTSNTLNSNSRHGAYISSNSNYNTLSGNTADYNIIGIEIGASDHITMRNNTMSNNNHNFYFNSDSDADYENNDIDTSNLVQGKPIYYLYNQSDLTYDGINMGTLLCISCNNISVKNITLSANNYSGVYFRNTSSSTIDNVTSNNSVHGIMLQSSDSNNIINNSINIGEKGLYLYSSDYNFINNNKISSSLDGIYLDLSSSNELTNNTILNGKTSIYDNRTNTYSDNSFLYNAIDKSLTYTNINRLLNAGNAFNFNIKMFDASGASCPTCIYSIYTSPIENVSSVKIGNSVTSTLAFSRNGIYSLTTSVIDSNNNTTKKLFNFLVGETATTTAKYYLRGINTTHGQPVGNGGDSKSMGFNEPIKTESWECGMFVQNSPDELPNYPLSSISSINIRGSYKSNSPGSVGAQKLLNYSSTMDYSQSLSTSPFYTFLNKTISGLSWPMDGLKNWYWLAIKLVGNAPSWQTSPSNLAYTIFTHQHTITPAIKSSSNDNIMILSATAPTNATSSATIVLDNPNVSATSTTLILTDFRRPFWGASSTIDSNSTTTITTTIGANTSSTLEAIPLDLVPSSGSVGVTIDTWNISGDYYKKWTEEGSIHNISTEHTVGNMKPDTKYTLKVDNSSLASYTSDSSGNIIFTYNGGYSTKIFELIEDITPPNINIIGSNPASVYQNQTYVDAGATAIDDIDGNITANMVTTSTVNTSIIGSYLITYTASDAAGNTSTTTRAVNVIARESGTNNTGGSRLIYVSQNQNNQDQQNNISWTDGSWIKTQDSKTVYFLDKNNIRHSYPNQNIWESYFGNDFSSVKEISKETLSIYPLGRNVPYKSGSLVKMPSTPKVYLVGENAIMQWLKTENTAKKLFGNLWNKIIKTLDESLFGDYVIGADID